MSKFENLNSGYYKVVLSREEAKKAYEVDKLFLKNLHLFKKIKPNA
jgi:hypothetical protein